MSNKIFVGILLVVLIIAGYVIYNNSKDEERVNGTGVSFMCQDGTAFIAEFSADMDAVVNDRDKWEGLWEEIVSQSGQPVEE